MKCLIVEDDFAARKLLHVYLSDIGDCYIAINGHEEIKAFSDATEAGEPYDLICLDIMMPKMDGHDTLRAIRKIESEAGLSSTEQVKVIMTTGYSDPENVMEAFRIGCEAYIVKPVRKYRLFEELIKLGIPIEQISR